MNVIKNKNRGSSKVGGAVPGNQESYKCSSYFLVTRKTNP